MATNKRIKDLDKATLTGVSGGFAVFDTDEKTVAVPAEEIAAAAALLELKETVTENSENIGLCQQNIARIDQEKATKTELAAKADADSVYTKTETDAKIPTKTSQLTNDSGFLTKINTGYWEDVTSKVGSLNSSTSGGRFGVYLNRVLKEIWITGWATFSSENAKDTVIKIFDFNTDLPGDDTTRLFSSDITCNASGILATVRIRPNTTSDSKQANSISVDCQKSTWTTAEGISVIIPIMNYADEFYKYIDAKE